MKVLDYLMVQWALAEIACQFSLKGIGLVDLASITNSVQRLAEVSQAFY